MIDHRFAATVLLCLTAAGVDANEIKTAPYPGTLTLRVDATDTTRRIFRVQETIPVQAGKLDLYYPKWIPGNHRPTGPIVNLTGIIITGNGKRIAWRRDLLDMYTLHLDVPVGVDSLEVRFQYLSPIGDGAAAGGISATAKIVDVEWNKLVLYPAGYAARAITIAPTLTLPAGWNHASALDADRKDGSTAAFKPVALNVLVDSPVLAGTNFRRVDLAPGARVPVHMDIVADHASNLVMSDTQIQQHRNLVAQAVALLGSQHYDHYDFLLTLSDDFGFSGLEHHRSSDNRIWANFFTDADAPLAGDAGDLLAHEYVHSWNGKFRRPADLATPHFNVAMRSDLLWVYEGLTEYLGKVLSARAGLYDPEQFRAVLAWTAAQMDKRPGRGWRPLQDTADSVQTLYAAPDAWKSWRRAADYYPEGVLLWLDVDTTIRERSRGKKSLDDFVRAFYGMDDGQPGPRTYVFDDVVNALNAVQPNDWAAFLRQRLDSTDVAAPLDGIARSGWKLAYTATPSAVSRAYEKILKFHDFTDSVGLDVDAGDKPGLIRDVLWDSPAFAAGLAPGMLLVAVNGEAYNADRLNEAIATTARDRLPIQLLVRIGDAFSTIAVDYHGGPKYPNLVRIPGTPDRLSAIIAARK
ncbi:MAG: M61 family metallopeptidase [Proteobacteria bacterium]|nr:M61 family metallopeptidase [Pseudomonadota bacterium]